MPSPSRAARFLVLVFALALALLAPWPGIDRVYASLFRSVANVAVGSIGGDGAVEFIALPQPVSGMDTQMILRNRATEAQARSPLSVRLIGFVPSSLVVALCIATPLPWSRRLVVALVGLALVQIFVVLRVYLRLVEVFSTDDTLAVFQFGPVVKSTIRTLSQSIAVSLFGSFVAPLLIWVAVAVRPCDWRQSPANAANPA